MIKELFIGIVTAIIANVLGIYLYVYFFSKENIDTTLEMAYNEGYLGKIVALGATLNLLAFFVYIKKRQDQRARGVLLATLCIAVVIMILKFI